MQKTTRMNSPVAAHHIDRIRWEGDLTQAAVAIISAVGADIDGTSKADRITLTDAVNGQTTTLGNDTIDALGGADYIESAAGNDQILAGAGNDVVFAGEGNDVVRLGNGGDCIDGGDGDDRIYGGEGDDLESHFDDSTGFVMGGLNGGRGHDLFRFVRQQLKDAGS